MVFMANTTTEKKPKKEKENKISQEDFLQLSLNFKDIELYEERIKQHQLMLENLEYKKQIIAHKITVLKANKKTVELKHIQTVDRISKETGIDIRNKTINPETLEVLE